MSSFDTGRRAPTLPHNASRLTFRRLRQPTPLPSVPGRSWGQYLARLNWLFS